MTSPYLIAILAYLIGLTGLSVFLSRRVKTGADFMVAGRGLSLPILVGTLFATWIGSGTIIASAGLSYRVGISALWGPSGAWLGIFLLFFIARRARRLKAFTIPDLLEARYNPAARLLGTLVTVIAYTVITSYQFRAGGMVLNLVGGIDPEVGMAVTAIFVIAFTAFAGMVSVAYTDFVNGVILTVGILVSFPMILADAGGWEGLTRSLGPEFFAPFHGETEGIGAMNLFLPTLLLLLGESNMYSRFFSARDEGVAYRAVIWWIIGVVIIETCVVLIGTSGRILSPDLAARYPELANPSELIVPHLILTTLHPAIGILLLAATAAIIVSTADSFLLTPAVNVQHDLWERFVRPWLRAPVLKPDNHGSDHSIETQKSSGNGPPERRMRRLCNFLPESPTDRERILFLRVVVILLGIWAYLQVTFFPNVLQAALYAYTMYGASLTPAILAAFTWKRATPLAGACSVATGMITTLLWEFALQPRLSGSALGEVDPVIPAVLLSILTLVVVSLISRPPEREKWQPFFDAG